MPFCKFRKSDGVYLGGVRWGTIPVDDTEVGIQLRNYPDRELDRWDGANGVRKATAQERTDEKDRVSDIEVAQALTDKKINAVIVWIEGLHGIAHADAIAALRAIWKTL